MELDYWALTDVGRVREHNEDNFLVDADLKLFIVCDGMGGHAAGEVASSLAVRVIHEYVIRHVKVIEGYRGSNDDEEGLQALLQLLVSAIEDANHQIYEMAQTNRSCRGMGTTCSLLLLRHQHAFVAHVGDSRVYLYRQPNVYQVTEDHSLVEEMIRSGLLSYEEKDTFENRNAVTRAVGARESLQVATYHFDVEMGDLYLLCSDGLCGYFPDADEGPIRSILDQEDLQLGATHAIQYANEKGGHDNITCVLVRLESSENEVELGVDDVVKVLKSTSIFGPCDESDLEELVEISRRIEVAGACYLGWETFGESQLIVVIEGECERHCLLEGTAPTSMRAGDTFGLAALFGKLNHPYEIRTSDRLVLLGIEAEDFRHEMFRKPAMGVPVLWAMIEVLLSGADDCSVGHRFSRSYVDSMFIGDAETQVDLVVDVDDTIGSFSEEFYSWPPRSVEADLEPVEDDFASEQEWDANSASYQFLQRSMKGESAPVEEFPDIGGDPTQPPRKIPPYMKPGPVIKEQEGDDVS